MNQMPGTPSDSARRAGGALLTGAGALVGLAAPAHAQVRFEPWSSLPFERGVQTAAPADMNGDGFIDLAFFPPVDLSEDPTIHIAFNDGLGELEPIDTGIVVRRRPLDVVAADIDGNGTTDLVWTSFYPGALNVFYNDGDGRSGRVESQVISEREPADLIAADFLGDLRPDIAVVDGAQTNGVTRVHIFFSRNGRLVQAPSVDLPLPEGASISHGDFDGDGDLDLGVLCLWRERRNGYGKYLVDLAEIAILENLDRNGFRNARSIALPYGGRTEWNPLGLAAGDFDGDGDIDLAISAVSTYQNMEARVIVNVDHGREFQVGQPTPFGRFSQAYESWLSPADLDGDGDVDLVAVDRTWNTQTAWILSNQGESAFDVSEVQTPSPTQSRALLADIRHQGVFDLVVPCSASLEVYANTTRRAGPQLTSSPLHRGEAALLTVTGAQRSETVWFVYSRAAPGNSVGVQQLGGITLDLLDPIQLIGSAVADSNGVAELTVTIPPNAPLTTVVMQAVIRRGPGGVDSVKTPFRTARIERN